MVAIGLGKNLLFKSVLAHCGTIIRDFRALSLLKYVLHWNSPVSLSYFWTFFTYCKLIRDSCLFWTRLLQSLWYQVSVFWILKPTILPLDRMVQNLRMPVLSCHGTAKNVCHHKFSIWLIGLFNVNWVFFQMYFLFSFQQRCKTAKLDFKPLQNGQILTSTHKNWQTQVSTTEVIWVCFVWQRGHSQSMLGKFFPFLTTYLPCQLRLWTPPIKS